MRRLATTDSILRWSERCLWVAGLLALGYCAFVLLDARIYQASESRRLDQALQQKLSVRRDTADAAQSAPAAAPARLPPKTVPPQPGSLIGRLEIPRIGLSAMVLEGSDDRTLQLGVGHLHGAALPGAPGNVVLAGHRDTFFRPLRNIRKGDKITVTTTDGINEYWVESAAVVDPDQTQLLQASWQPTLTLVTCYPFSYLGAAPKRFIVQAREGAGPLPAAAEPPAKPLTYAATHQTGARSRHIAAIAFRGEQREIRSDQGALDAGPSAPTTEANAVETSGDESVPRPHRGIKRIPGRILGKLGGILRRRGKQSEESNGAS